MVVEIVPRPKVKPKRPVAILFYLSLILLILTIAAYFGLYSVKDDKNRELEELGAILAAQETNELRIIKKELLDYQGKVDDLSILIDSYREPTKFLQFLGSITHPKVMWSNLNLDLTEGKASVSGQTESITTLIQQSYIFEGDSRILDFELASFSVLEEGGVSLAVDFSFNPELFK